MVDGCGEILLLLEQHVEFCLTFLAMLVAGIGALGLFAHVINLQSQDAQPVDGPSRAFGVDGGVGQRLYIALGVAEIAVYLLYEVCAVLVRLVDAPLQLQGCYGVDVRVANDVFIVPLHGVDPAFQVEPVFYGITIIGVIDGCINVVFHVVVANSQVEDFVALFGK